MNIPATQIRTLLKKLSGVKSDQLTLDTQAGVLAAEDNELAIRVQSDALRDTEGAIVTVNGRKLSTTLARLSGIVSLNLTENGLSVTSAKSSFSLEGKAGEKVKPITFSEKDAHTFNLANLTSVVKIASTATKNGHTKYRDAIELTYGGDFVKATGTNELRLFSSSTGEAPAEVTGVAVPVSLVTSLAALTSETIAFSVGPKVIAARETTEDGTVVIAARRPVVQFPDFDKFLKQEFSRRVTVDAAAGKEALLRTQAFVDSDLKSVKVVLHAKEIQLLARHAGKAEDYIPIVSEKEADEDDPFAEPETVSFYVNHGFLVDFFEASSGEVVLASDPKVPLIGLFNGNRVAILTQLEAS